jgi:pimeloyl-ACP methyl ester carboxylesterase
MTVTHSWGTEEIALVHLGHGPPWLIAWHGFGLANRLSGWELVLPSRPGRSILLAGLPGHGRVARQSQAAYAAWTPDSFIEAGIQVLQKTVAEVGGPLVIAGASLGAAMALGAATHEPALATGLILLSPVVWGETAGLVRAWASLAGHPGICRRVLDICLAPGRRWPRCAEMSLWPLVADRAALSGNDALRRLIRENHAESRSTSSRAMAAVLRVLGELDLRKAVYQTATRLPPALILHGTRDPIVPYAQSCWLVGELPAAELIPLPRTGHVPQGECPEVARRVIEHWLARTGSLH